MAIINKYWIIIESLHFPIVGAPAVNALSEEQRVKANLKILKDTIAVSPDDIIRKILKTQTSNYLEHKLQQIIGNYDDYFLYCLYSLEVLLEIYKNANFSSNAKEDLVSEKHKALILSSMEDIASIAFQGNLHGAFYKDEGGIFKKRFKSEIELFRLEFTIATFSPLMYVKALHIGKSLDDVQLWYMASIFSLLIAFDSKDYHLEPTDVNNLQTKLHKLWVEFSKKLYYRNLMLLYSNLAPTKKQRLHKEMLMRLWSPGGYVALLFAMTESQHSEEQSLDEIVANLVAQPNFSIKAQYSLMEQILQFLRTSLKSHDLSALIGTGLLSLQKLYNNKVENKEYIKNWLKTEVEPLINVEKSKIVAMEWDNFVDLVSLLFHVFCTSSIATLPSELLVPYLPVFVELCSQIECRRNQDTLRHHLHSLVLRILNNRTEKEIAEIIKFVSLKLYPKEWFQLSFNIQIKENALNMEELKLGVVDIETAELMMSNRQHLAILVAMLKSSSYNLLVYQFFLVLLQLIPSLIIDINSSTASNTNIDLLESKDEIYNKILMDFSQKYEHKLQILKALETLVQHQPLKPLINDNIKNILKVLQDILYAYTKTLTKDSCKQDINTTALMILLILIKEIIDNCSTNGEDIQTNLFKPLKYLEAQTESENLKYQINCLLSIEKGNESFYNQQCDFFKNEFEEARELIQSNKSYLQVEGIEKMKKLLYKRDAFTVANGHMLTVLALNTLKSPESYTFLNCVRLFVELVNVNELEVFELLSDEYLNEESGIDYRLVIGETILKTAKELGPLCYKYKNVLLNTCMTGCRSTLDEFRFSAFSNLSQMCRQLTYQVHSYFEELLNLIDCELTTGKYLPTKRAAVMILSELLAGMDNLFDYEEMLLPIYRLLKLLVASEQYDEKIRLHASNGLMCLSEKCKDLFKISLEQYQSGNILEKQIKIMGINDKPKKNLKHHILEIN